ncbi:MAG: formate dehydrogenase accessory sulfurtransferase FdhD [Deltaproteobacteria bacterium]|nr:formate dehydrogenase accessory sulfurtransferase FdhD [Deltaproteobacteria bacterium]
MQGLFQQTATGRTARCCVVARAGISHAAPVQRAASDLDVEPGDTTRTIGLRRRAGGAWTDTSDEVAREEPLEIQLGPVSLAVIMRTPGHDEELALGFLVTERVVASPADVLAIRHCTTATSPQAEDNILRVTLAPHVAVDLEALRRNLYANSSCGICGKATIENAMATAAPLDDPSVFDAALLVDLPARMAAAQQTFARTGGLHAAALFDASGELLAVREDVGRHNAVDKVVGWATGADLLPLSGHILMVSGRISFEIVQKALAARIPLIAAVSAPSSLAVQLAEAAGLGLVGFLRGNTMNLYANTARVRG